MGLEKEKDELLENQKMTKKQQARLQEIEKRMTTLQQFMEDAAAQRQAVKDCVGMRSYFLHVPLLTLKLS